MESIIKNKESAPTAAESETLLLLVIQYTVLYALYLCV